jgi:DNA sulfur modification protein DndB
MATYFPVIRAGMGDLEYFVSVVTFGEVARMVEYVERVDGWTPETPPELKLQRKLNLQRVEREMVPYLLGNADHFHSALTVEIRPAPRNGHLGTVSFTTKEGFPGGIEFGILTLDGTEKLCALDGQHRLKSIETAIRRNPELAREHIALILVPFQSVVRSQTLFSDLNRYAKSPSKSLSLLFTHRERLARIAKGLADAVPLLRGRVNMEYTSLSTNSRDFVTLSTLYEMTETMAGDRSEDESVPEAQLVAEQATVWERLTRVIEEWRQVAEQTEHPAYLRQRFLNMHGVTQQAIALALSGAHHDLQLPWGELVAGLRGVDWRLTNPQWQGIALHGGRVNNSPTSVKLLADALRVRLGPESGGVSAR